MRAELEKNEEGKISYQRTSTCGRKETGAILFIKPQTCCVRGMGTPTRKIWRVGEEDVTMRQDVTATSGASSSIASRGPAKDIESRPSRKRAADVQTEDLEENEQMDANESAASLPQAEEEAIGNTTSLKRNQHLEDKVAGDEYLGLDESMDITTVIEQGAQWDFTNVEMRNQAFKKKVAEKHSCL